MGTEQNVARGIQRQKVAQARANMAGGFGCIGTAIVVTTLVALATGNQYIAALFGFIAGLVALVWIYQRVLSRNLNR